MDTNRNMKTLLIFTALTISLTAGSPVTRIVNGKEAQVGQFPYQALLYSETPQGKALCGGVLLNNRFVLTAAHCLLNAKYVEVHLGAHDRTNTTEEGRLVFNSKEFQIHEKFNILAHNDIGIVKLPDSVVFTDRIKPVKVPKSNTDKYVDETAVVSGWGLEHNNELLPPKKLRFTELKVISNAECRKEYNFLLIKDTTLCAKGENMESACLGDSGGPLVLKETGELVGLASFVAIEGCEAGHSNGFTRVNKYLDWIQKHLE